MGINDEKGFKIQTTSSQSTFGFNGFSAFISDGTFDYELVSNQIINLNEYYNLTIVIDRDNNKFKFYINGILNDEAYINTDFGNVDLGELISIGQQSLGNLNTNSFHWLNGKVRQSFNLGKALTQNEIQQYSSCPPSSNESDLIGLWNFEEGSDAIVYDQTNNENNGTINGAEYSSDAPQQLCQLTTVNGCDSVAVLNLTINQSDTSIINVTTCESYEWNDSII